MGRRNVAREKLCSAMVRLLLRKPLPDITVKELVSMAGVNRTSFYYYFDNTQSVVDLITHTFVDELFEAAWSGPFREHGQGDAAEVMSLGRDSLRHMVYYLYRRQNTCYVIVRRGYQAQVVRHLRHLIDQNMHAALFEVAGPFDDEPRPLVPGAGTDFEPYRTSYLTLATVDYLVHRNFADDPGEIADTLFEVMTSRYTAFKRSGMG